MRRFISITFFLCLLLSLQAQEVYTTKNIPKVHLQDKTRYVCNPAGILSTEACDNIVCSMHWSSKLALKR